MSMSHPSWPIQPTPVPNGMVYGVVHSLWCGCSQCVPYTATAYYPTCDTCGVRLRYWGLCIPCSAEYEKCPGLQEDAVEMVAWDEDDEDGDDTDIQATPDPDLMV